jgi:hypothetical protein
MFAIWVEKEIEVKKSFTSKTKNPIEPRLLFQLKLQTSRIRFILYILGHP